MDRISLYSFLTLTCFTPPCTVEPDAREVSLIELIRVSSLYQNNMMAALQVYTHAVAQKHTSRQIVPTLASYPCPSPCHTYGHTDSHTHTRARTHTHTQTNKTHTHTHTLTHSHTHTHTTHTHTHTHTDSRRPCGRCG